MFRGLTNRLFAVLFIVCLLCCMFICLPVFATESNVQVDVRVSVPDGFKEHVVVYLEKTDNFEESYSTRTTASRGYVSSLLVPAGKYNVTAFLENGDYRYKTTLLNHDPVLEISNVLNGNSIVLEFETKFDEAYSEGATLPPDAVDDVDETEISSEGTDATIVKNGFLFLRADVLSGFSEKVKVLLTDIETEDEYPFYLYAANDYMGNFKVPVGGYTVEAMVVSDIKDVSFYAAVCDPEIIQVKDNRLATGVIIDVAYDSAIDPVVTEGLEDPEEEAYKISVDTEWVTGKKRGSVLGSALVSILVILAGAVVMVYLKRR